MSSRRTSTRTLGADEANNKFPKVLASAASKLHRCKKMNPQIVLHVIPKVVVSYFLLTTVACFL